MLVKMLINSINIMFYIVKGFGCTCTCNYVPASINWSTWVILKVFSASHTVSSDGSSISQYQRSYNFFKYPNLLRSCTWRRLWTYDGI